MSSTDEDFYVPDTEEQTEVQDVLYIQDPKDNCNGQSTWAIEDSTNVHNAQEYLVIQEIQGNQDTLDVKDGKENLGTLDSQEEKEAAIKNTLKELLIYTFFLVVISTGNIEQHF
jgi:hypothetical protein